MNPHSNLIAPVLCDAADVAAGCHGLTYYIVKPTAPSVHIRYTFYIKASATGGSFQYFGPYYLDVGCIESTTGDPTKAVDYVDNGLPLRHGSSSNLVTNYQVHVGDDPNKNPTAMFGYQGATAPFLPP